MQTDFITAILRLPATEVSRFQAMAKEACARAATPQLKRLPLPYVTEAALRCVETKEEADIAARLLDELGRLLDTTAAKDYNGFVENQRMVRSSASVRAARCLKREPTIEREGSVTAQEAEDAVQRIWHLLLDVGIVACARSNDDRAWYKFHNGAQKQPFYDFDAIRRKAIGDWQSLQKPSRPRLKGRR